MALHPPTNPISVTPASCTSCRWVCRERVTVNVRKLRDLARPFRSGTLIACIGARSYAPEATVPPLHASPTGQVPAIFSIFSWQQLDCLIVLSTFSIATSSDTQSPDIAVAGAISYGCISDRPALRLPCSGGLGFGLKHVDLALSNESSSLCV